MFVTKIISFRAFSRGGSLIEVGISNFELGVLASFYNILDDWGEHPLLPPPPRGCVKTLKLLVVKK